jgi:hypothetical protein
MAQGNNKLDRVSLSLEFIDVINNIFKNNYFDCKKLFYRNENFIVNNVYYSTIDVLRCLNFEGKEKDISIILANLQDDCKFTIDELEKKYIELDLKQNREHLDFNKELLSKLNNYEKKEIYVNNQGLFHLIEYFENDEAMIFQNFIYNIFLPALDKHYENIITRLNARIDELTKKLEVLNTNKK